MGTAYSVTGTGPGSADKQGQKGSEHLFVGVEKLIGTRVVFAGTVSLSGTMAAVLFPEALAGVNSDYIVMCNAPHLTYASAVTTSGFTANGTTSDTVSYVVVRVPNATVTVTPVI